VSSGVSPEAATGVAPLPELARLWPRFGAIVYDGVLLFGILFITSWLFTVLTGDATRGPGRLAHQAFLTVVIGTYFVYCWRRSGQTLAMKTWGLRLVTTSGQVPTLGQAIGRYVLALAGLLCLGAGFLWAAVDRDRQFLHDRLMGTRIVRAPI
jgi:uncharacterized RDD family membrane protein YckC